MGILVPGISFFNLKDYLISPTKLISFFEKFEVFNNISSWRDQWHKQYFYFFLN